MRGQHVLKDTLNDAACHGAPFVLRHAVAMTADPAVTRHFPEAEMQVITPLFTDEEIVFAKSGVLLHCPGVIDGAGGAPLRGFFPGWPAFKRVVS